MAFAKAALGQNSFYRKLLSRFSWRAKEESLLRNQKKPYIVPTQFGLVFGAVVFVILIFALGYANNVIYIFVFLLVSSSITSMWLTNRNLEFIRFKKVFAVDLFAQQENILRVSVENLGKRHAYAFEVSMEQQQKHLAEIPALGESIVELNFNPKTRGLQLLPRMSIQSTFPFDLLRTWRSYRSPDKVLVYPALKGTSNFPVHAHASANADQMGLFRDLREYSSGDPVRRIDWRASTKHQDLFVKVFESEESQSFEFNWDDTRFLSNFEDRVSQLALWVSLCEKYGNRYSLSVGQKLLPLGSGLLHFRSCMTVLAELGVEDIS